MSIPVIDTTTNVMGYKQWQYWEYQPYATNNPTSWECPNLPAGLSIDSPTQYAATGVASTNVVTAAGNDFTEGMRVVFPLITGGAGLAVATIYFIRELVGDAFKLSATRWGDIIDFTTDITAAFVSRLPTGKISGAATVASPAFNCGLVAANADGTSVPLMLTIGIEAAAASLTNSGYQVEIDVATREIVLVGGGSLKIFARENDSLLLWIVFKKGGQTLDLDIQSMEIAIKEFSPDRRIILGTAWKKYGSGTGAYYGLHATISGQALRASLNNYAKDNGTIFDGLTEIGWTETNPDTVTFGPENFRFSSRDFATTLGADSGTVA